jgi:uncharacterized protein YcfJ
MQDININNTTTNFEDELITELNNELVIIKRDAMELYALQKASKQYIDDSQPQLTTVENNIKETDTNSEAALFNVADSARIAPSSNIKLKFIAGASIVGSVIGGGVGVIGGPAGIAIGAAAGATLFGSVGGGIAKLIDMNKQYNIDKELIDHRDQGIFKNADKCGICNTAFTLLRGRHHCRICGESVCSNCSPFTLLITYKGISEP